MDGKRQQGLSCDGKAGIVLPVQSTTNQGTTTEGSRRNRLEAILLELLHQIATAKDLMSVSLAAGVAHEQLLANLAEQPPGGQSRLK